MTREIKTTKRAKTDIADIYRYTEDRWGRAQADEYIGGLIAQIEQRGQNPEHLSRKESSLARRLRLNPGHVGSFMYEKQYRCYFHFDDRQFHVLSVLHHAREEKKAFREIAKEFRQ